ncbi:hypothetical protein QQ045_030326 [Rhodiola kirilowii]
MSKRTGCDEDSDCINCRVGAKEREEDRVIEFLMGLNDVHSPIRNHILALRELPNLDVVYDMVLNDESEQTVTRPSYSEVSAMYSRHLDGDGSSRNQMRNSKGKHKGRLFCTHCQMNGHTKEFCYKLNGYPPGHKLYKGKNTNNRNLNGEKGGNAVSVDTSHESDEYGSSKGN